MDFAKKQLLKYGWKEGDGLGKNNDGITSALKPKLKFDKFGMGHDPAKEFTSRWWENTYKNALDNVEVSQLNGEFSVTTKTNFNDLEKKQKKANYESFLKTSTLTNEGYEVEEKHANSSANVEIKEVPSISDEDLLKACGKRTAHKGARHGLTLSGKLARIRAQEEELMLLEKYKNKATLISSNNEDIIKDDEMKKTNNKIKRKKHMDDIDPVEEMPETLTKKIKKKKKKKD